MTDSFSWNLLADLRQMWSLPFMLNAFRGGSIVAVLAAAIGWFMVLRRQTFVGHTLAVVGFPGAAAAVWLGLGVSTGYFAFCLGAALVLATRSGTTLNVRQESAAVGTLQAFTLACGMVFVSRYGGFLNSTTGMLFGSALGITAAQVTVLAAVSTVVLTALALIGRPLLLATVDPAVAQARGVPVRLLSTAYLLLLAATTAEVSQITGALLVFALLVFPAATAQLVTASPMRSLLLALGIAWVITWAALFLAYYTPFPLGFWLTSAGFGLYAATAAARSGRHVLLRHLPRPAEGQASA
jgi:zinc/manganese transport system permease protein